MAPASAQPASKASVGIQFRRSLASFLQEYLHQHLKAAAVGLFPAAFFIYRCAHTTTQLFSRLARAFLAVSALFYFPSIAFGTSVVVATLTFLLQRSHDIEALLQRLVAAATDPLVNMLLARMNSSSSSPAVNSTQESTGASGTGKTRYTTDAHLRLRSSNSGSSVKNISAAEINEANASFDGNATARPLTPVVRPASATGAYIHVHDLHEDLRDSTDALVNREAELAAQEPRSPLRALVRIFTSLGLRAALAALTYVAERRFGEALVSVPSARGHRLPAQVAVSILRSEMVSAIVNPFNASVKMYLYGTLVVALLLFCGPFWLVR